MGDKQIECIDCQQFFVFTGGEQEFYRGKGFSEPKRCKPCREVKKEKREGRRKQ